MKKLIALIICVLVFTVVSEARTVSIVESENPGSVKLRFGTAESQDTLYLHAGYGTTDGGDTPGGWANFVYIADITPDMTEYDCVLPSGWGTSVTHVRYFLTTENPAYAFSYDHITLKGNNTKGSYFKTGYTPIPTKTHVVTDFKVGDNRNMALFCSRGNSGNPTFTQLYLSTGPTLSFDCGPQNNATYRSSISAASGTRYLVESGPNLTVCPYEGESTTVEHPKLPEGTNFTTTAELYLFATHSNGGSLGNCANGEARFVRIYESDTGVYDKSTLVHEYVPVLNPNTGKGALYDTVDRKFIEPTHNDTTQYACEFVGQHAYEYETAGSSESFAFVPRTIEVVSVTSAGGTTKATLAVSAGNLVREAIVLALGNYDYGVELSAWPTKEVLNVVSPAAQEVEVQMPSEWNTAACSSARLFLVHASQTEVVPESQAQTASKPVFASSARASVTDGSVRIKVTAPEGQTWYAYLAYAKTDMGPDPVAWGTNVVILAGGTGTGSGVVDCGLPEDWSMTKKSARVFLSTSAPLMTYEYLKGDGKAYLDLGRKGVLGDMVSFKCRFNIVAGNGFRIFGARQSDATMDNFSIQGNGNMYLDYSDYSLSRVTGAINAADTATWLDFVSSPTLRQILQNGMLKGKDENLVTKAFETADNLRLFDVGGWSANGGILNGCIKDFVLQHAEGSVTNDVMRLVPVYDAESKKYGMFDEVRGKFLLNAASSGAFSADGAGETGARAYPAYKCSGVSKLVSGGVGLMVIVK